MWIKAGVVDVNPIAMSNAFSFVKDIPEDGLVVMLILGRIIKFSRLWKGATVFH